MRQHRGLTESTLAVYQGILVGLLETLDDDPRGYTAEALRAFVLERARPHGISRAKSIVVAVRAFLGFLGATGRCAPGMEHAIPGFASWQLSSIPRCLCPEDVERVIDSCAGHATGLRDRAVILLLARLGLRASEVAGLGFADSDWDNGRIAVLFVSIDSGPLTPVTYGGARTDIAGSFPGFSNCETKQRRVRADVSKRGRRARSISCAE
jgi:integrase/recombinase XerD